MRKMQPTEHEVLRLNVKLFCEELAIVYEESPCIGHIRHHIRLGNLTIHLGTMRDR